MRKLAVSLILVAGVLTLASVLLANPGDQTADMLKSEATQAIAKGEFALGDGLLSTDYVGLRAPDGRVLSSFGDASMMYTAIDSHGLQVSIFGNTGVATGIVKVSGSQNGKPTTALYRYSRVYTSKDGQWQPVFTQLTCVVR